MEADDTHDRISKTSAPEFLWKHPTDHVFFQTVSNGLMFFKQLPQDQAYPFI